MNVARKQENDRVGRWNCYDCKSSYNVLSGTIFQGTQVPLQKWFATIALVANAKKSISSPQLARDLRLNQKTAWYMLQRIRAEMAKKGKKTLLKGILEADETYIGGKPRKGNKRKDDNPDDKPKPGRGTKKTPVLGVVERGGEVKAEVSEKLGGREILNFIMGNVNPEESTLMTDEFASYQAVDSKMKHEVIKHKEQYVDGEVHTDTIEGFWSLLKRAWYGQHHHYTKQFTPLYVAEACYKYNHRNTKNVFDVFIRGCFV